MCLAMLFTDNPLSRGSQIYMVHVDPWMNANNSKFKNSLFGTNFFWSFDDLECCQSILLVLNYARRQARSVRRTSTMADGGDRHPSNPDSTPVGLAFIVRAFHMLWRRRRRRRGLLVSCRRRRFVVCFFGRAGFFFGGIMRRLYGRFSGMGAVGASFQDLAKRCNARELSLLFRKESSYGCRQV